MPSRNRVAGGVEPLDFAAADEAVGELVKVVVGEDDDGLAVDVGQAGGAVAGQQVAGGQLAKGGQARIVLIRGTKS